MATYQEVVKGAGYKQAVQMYQHQFGTYPKGMTADMIKNELLKVDEQLLANAKDLTVEKLEEDLGTTVVIRPIVKPSVERAGTVVKRSDPINVEGKVFLTKTAAIEHLLLNTDLNQSQIGRLIGVRPQMVSNVKVNMIQKEQAMAIKAKLDAQRAEQQ